MRAAAGPRIAPLPAGEWSEEARTALRGHVARIDQYLSGQPDAPTMPPVLGVLGRHPQLAGAWLQLNGVLLNSTVLDARLRELVILRVAWLAGSDYEWRQHARIGREAGLSAEQIEGVVRGPDASVWCSNERTLLRAADELMSSKTLSDATWEQLARFLDDRQLIELLFVVGAYLCVALVFNGAAIPAPHPPNGAPEGHPRRPEDRG
ncbi:MAG TPA: carboxymuconolactone decarboxylase family protein [Acidimicrobiales bacterium]|nr:carboxymuconolactone decarboxylase family protein [Acidimicrobiales bacterium]